MGRGWGGSVCWNGSPNSPPGGVSTVCHSDSKFQIKLESWRSECAIKKLFFLSKAVEESLQNHFLFHLALNFTSLVKYLCSSQMLGENLWENLKQSNTRLLSF